MEDGAPEGSQPKILYHYTNAAGFLGILETNSLWATNVAFMSDASELRYARQFIADYLDERAQLLEEDTAPHSLLTHTKVIELLLDSHFQVFVSCFCEKGDVLSQWQGYGSRGGGFALGFNRESLEHMAIGANEYMLRRVLYQPDEQRAALAGILDPLIVRLEKEEEENGREAARSLMMRECLAQAQYACIEVATTFKDPVFEVEEEWRLIVIAERDVPAGRLKFRAARRYIVPYIELDLRQRAGHQTNRLPLTEVVQGPTLDPELSERSVRQLLDARGYPWTHTETRGSAVPLRDPS